MRYRSHVIQKSCDTEAMGRLLEEELCGRVCLSPTGPGRGGKLGDLEGGCWELLERRHHGRGEEAPCCRAPLWKHVPRRTPWVTAP